ncbi:MAG: Alkaline phosphatase synthesis sensor protein PhoR [Bacteroidia bacterium]|jgi:signal transduction histidine kinase|nr:MAG: Alkaline phosphatase synthesis sensor protein PhoR [Bacteroidia bacterium]
MRLKVLIIFVIVYILSAFVWLTFSLLNYSNTDYQLKNNVLKAGLNACTLQVIEKAKNNELGTSEKVFYRLKRLEIDINEDSLSQFIDQRFNGNYIAEYANLSDDTKFIRLAINPKKIEELKFERYQQRNIWLYQSILLLFLVGVGIYGVFSSIEKIYKLNKQQNNFLLSVTHEFKTPIAAIRLMLQTSKHPKVNDEKRIELVDNSIQSTHRLEELAENMLTAMQIESNAYQYNLSPVDYSNLVNKVINNQQIKGQISAEVEPDIVVEGDDFILRMVVNNLIENAFKYSNNQPIEVSLTKDQKWKRLSIKDQGIGLKKEDYKNIFKKFYRVQDEETRVSKGTGLGLFIVKQAVEKHSGKVFVSANADKGSTFTILLP